MLSRLQTANVAFTFRKERHVHHVSYDGDNKFQMADTWSISSVLTQRGLLLFYLEHYFNIMFSTLTI